MLTPPTSKLPAIRTISSVPTEALLSSVEYLKKLYIPEVRGSRRQRATKAADALQAEATLDPADVASELDELRSDSFEKTYAIRWLTALISQAEAWDEDEEDLEPSETPSAASFSRINREALIQEAASLLAICAGTSAAGILTRDFVLGSSDDNKTPPISVRVRDVPLDNADYGSVGAQTWGGACVLAEMIMDDPDRFGISPSGKGLRILELGAGTGLVGMAVGKLVEGLGIGMENTQIVLTDYYPSVLQNLQYNVEANFPTPCLIHISTEFLDWASFPHSPHRPPFHESFDLVLGADIIYEAEHAQWIKTCLGTLLRKPERGASSPVFHLAVPLRPTHSAESSTVEQVFPNLEPSKHHFVTDSDELDLCIFSKRTILCEAGAGVRADNVEYSYYQIGWA